MLISFSSRTWHLPTLSKVPKAGSMTMVLLCWLASKLAWPEPHRESMGYCQEEDERHQTTTMQMTWRPLSRQTGLPLHLSSVTGWSPPCHAHDAVIHAKRAQPSIECIEMNILFRSLIFLFKISLFYLSYLILKCSETLNLGSSLTVRHIHQHFKNISLEIFHSMCNESI